eukprot:CAMPEP_0181126148 /NCGR_PEP_ID=MMETSP1071-20121207/27454_1 /TAXON_ID=35127 /ORGANISM="Thalassiosira sp., Strain NH16" /LENGTH=1409 /DNA_ID=CAMNT_0023211689 /DNA_START=213 /DNA_END=4439 /DNA_ORIENTATION=-
MTTSSENPHDWEFSKENAAPLEFGRSTKSLSKRAFGTSKMDTEKLEEKTKKYERLVRRSEKAVAWIQKQSERVLERSGSDNRELTEEEAQTLRDRLVFELGFDPSTTDRENVDFDPMRYWVLYIKHIRESYPSDSQKQFLVYERCARTFMARPFIVPSYQNEPRFIRICILYADQTSNPSEVFKLMSKIKVGTKVSIFWVAWAWTAEKAQDFQFTEKIFQKALSVGAKPRKFLEDRQRHFLRRMSRHWLNASKAQEDEVDEEEDDGRRGALNSLSSAGIAGNDRGSALNRHTQQRPNGSSRASSRATSQQQGRNENKPMDGFNIFQDGDRNSPRDAFDDENDPVGRRRLEKESERTKENSMRPELWNERGYGLVNPTTAASSGELPIGADSIVGTARGAAPALTAHHRSGSVAAFDVFVDEEFNADENDTNNVSRGDAGKKIDERSLRQRLDGGTADRLTRDPVRYMKNPGKMESDQIKYDVRTVDDGATTTSSSKPATMKRRDDRALKTGSEETKRHSEAAKREPKGSKASQIITDEQLRKKESNTEECCTFEQRLRSCSYKLVSPNDDINLLKEAANDQNNSSQMDFEESMIAEESIEEIDMEGDAEEIVMKPTKSVLKSSLRARNTTTKISEEELTGNVNPRRVLFGANTNLVYTNASINTSTASSQPNGSFVTVEETINTKLANAEISMMFSSPNGNASLAESPGESLLASSLFSTSRKKSVVDNGDSSLKGSAFAIHDENKLEPTGLNMSIYQDNTNKINGKKSNEDDKPDGLSFAIHDENKHDSGGLNIPIYQDASDENAGEKKKSFGDKPNGLSFAIHDECKHDSDGLNFSIFQDDSNESACGKKSTAVEKPNGLSFAIHDERKFEYGRLNSSVYENNGNHHAPTGNSDDTASLSVIGNIFDETKRGKPAPSMGFGIYSDTEPSKQTHHKTGDKQHSGRLRCEARIRESKTTDNTTEDTASLSIIDGVMDGLENCSVSEPQQSSSGFAIFSDENSMPSEPQFKIFADDDTAQKKPPRRPTAVPEESGFEIFPDEVLESAQKKQKTSNVLFASDISRIEDEKTSNFPILNENEVNTSSNFNPEENQLKAIGYTTQHNSDMESAMRKCMHAAAKSRSRYEIFDYRKKQMPKALLRKAFIAGDKIDLLGGETASIVHELGRGHNGVVLLYKDKSDQRDALKIQAPIGSLAHEYSLLLQIEKRVENDSPGFYPFPRSRAFYAFSEGGLFAMTAGSDSGMTLIDVVNTYKKITSNVPELVAIYYTSRMLEHLESLHQDAKVLHCDIKPDNWVLTSSLKDRNNAGKKSVGGSDIMLVDFGRSIDLEKVASGLSDPLKAQFKGSIAAEDMECVAMRKGLPWGVDLDFFGLAASSFILLFGSHIEIVQDRSTGKWRLSKSFRRYWQKDLW